MGIVRSAERVIQLSPFSWLMQVSLAAHFFWHSGADSEENHSNLLFDGYNQFWKILECPGKRCFEKSSELDEKIPDIVLKFE